MTRNQGRVDGGLVFIEVAVFITFIPIFRLRSLINWFLYFYCYGA